MVFIEQDADHPLGNRYGRWWAAFDDGSTLLPLAMVSSGHQIADGYLLHETGDLYTGYKVMVDAELLRPPQAYIEAYQHRVGDKLRFTVWVSNWSDKPLSWIFNGATVNAIVYEDAHVLLTDRIARAAIYTLVGSEITPWTTAAFTLETSDLMGVDWSKLHSVVFVDYRPNETSGAYDMLQAAYTLSDVFKVLPNHITFLVDPDDNNEQLRQVQFRGPDCFQWDVSTDTPWLSLTSITGTSVDSLDVSVITNSLSPGLQTGEIAIFATCDGSLPFSDRISVSAYYGEVNRIYLPSITR